MVPRQILLHKCGEEHDTRDCPMKNIQIAIKWICVISNTLPELPDIYSDNYGFCKV